MAVMHVVVAKAKNDVLGRRYATVVGPIKFRAASKQGGDAKARSGVEGAKEKERGKPSQCGEGTGGAAGRKVRRARARPRPGLEVKQRQLRSSKTEGEVTGRSPGTRRDGYGTAGEVESGRITGITQRGQNKEGKHFAWQRR